MFCIYYVTGDATDILIYIIRCAQLLTGRHKLVCDYENILLHWTRTKINLLFLMTGNSLQLEFLPTSFVVVKPLPSTATQKAICWSNESRLLQIHYSHPVFFIFWCLNSVGSKINVRLNVMPASIRHKRLDTLWRENYCITRLGE